MKFKNGVVRSGDVYYNGKWHDSEWTFKLKEGLKICDSISKNVTGKHIFITCGIGRLHSKTSRHPYGEAADLRTSIYTDEQKKILFDLWFEALNPHFKKYGKKEYVLIHEAKGTPNEHYHLRAIKHIV